MLSQYQVEVCLTDGVEWRFYSIRACGNARVVDVHVRNSWQQAAIYIMQRLPLLQEKPGERLPSIQESKDPKGDDDSDDGDADKENGGSSNDQPSAGARKGKGSNAGGIKGEVGDKGNRGNKGNRSNTTAGGGKKQGKRQEDVCMLVPLPSFFEDQLGVFTQRELELRYLETLPCMEQYLDA